MMFFTGNLRRGRAFLIHSAAGVWGKLPFSSRRRGTARFFGLASESKHGFLKSQGCQHALSSADYVNEVRKLTNGRGVDLILDPVGGKTWTESYELLAPAGRLVAFWSVGGGFGQEAQLGARSGPAVSASKKWSPRTLMDDNKPSRLQYGFNLFGELDLLEEQFRALVGMYEAGQIKPHVDRTFPFAEAAAAHHYIHDRKAKGKVLLILESGPSSFGSGSSAGSLTAARIADHVQAADLARRAILVAVRQISVKRRPSHLYGDRAASRRRSAAVNR